jgi:hypothetical protein
MSFDLVRAVRVDGKSRHKFVLGLGSLKNNHARKGAPVWFWANAASRMMKHGLDAQRRRGLARRNDARRRAGAANRSGMKSFREGWQRGSFRKAANEIIRWLRHPA